MGYRKFFSIFISIVLVVVTFCSMSWADSSESSDPDTVSGSGVTSVDRGDGLSFDLPEGLTITVPPEFEEPLWVGMSADDSALTASYGLDMVTEMYEEEHLSFQCDALPVGTDDGQFFFAMVHEKDAPSDMNESAFLSTVSENIISDEKDLEGMEILGSGLMHVGDIDFYKTCTDFALDFNYEVHARYKARVNKYSFVTESGKLFEIEIQLLSDPRNPDEAVPFTEEDLAHLDYLESYIIGGLQYEGKTVSIDAEAYPTPQSGDNGQEGGTAPSDTTNTNTTPSNQGSSSSSRNFFKSFTEFSFPLWILAAALVAVLIAGARVSKRHEWQEEPFSLDSSKAIQGLSAVCIILHHLSQDLLKEAGPFEFLSGCGVLFVGIFFFFSGYGLYTSLKTKKDYLKGFLKKRFITILIPFYMCIAVFTIASCICGTKYKPLELLGVLSGWSLINNHMWYIVEIAILYLAFFIIYKLIKNRTAATSVMALFALLMMGGSLYLCHGKDFSCAYWFMGEWWYNSSILFIVGILVSKHQDVLRKIARKGYVVLLPLFAILTAVFGKITSRFLEKYSYWSEIPGQDPRYLDKLRCLSVQVPFILCFVLFVLLVMMKVRFGNPVLKFLGAISLELYLIHNLFLQGLSNGTIFKVRSPSMYILLTILMSIGAATIISGTDKYLIGLLNGKRKAQKEQQIQKEQGAAVETKEQKEPIALKNLSSRNHSIDLMRIIMAFLVVAIHWPFAGSAGSVFITFGKTAVPFFLVVCGYMLYRDDPREMKTRLLKQLKRILIFFLASNVFYAAATALYDKKMNGKVDMRPYFTAKAMKDFLLYNFSPFSEHLWYLGSLLYALVILFILTKLRFIKPAIFLGPVLIAAYVVLSHMGVGEAYQLRNAILVGLAYTMTGMLIRRYEKKILNLKILPIILGVLAVGASIAAIIELRTYKQGTGVPFVGCEILTIVIVLLCLRFPNIAAGTYAEKLGRTCSLPIYIMHIFTMMVFLMTHNDAFFGKYGAVTIFVVTAVGVALYENIKGTVIRTKE
ncbi:MAG: acyltransferase [Clostridiales bacterium]|nr:acyltransferase [Clostridiales bacterium]